MTDPLRAICDHKGVFLRREALALGFNEQSFTKAVRAGVYHRVRHGSYVFADAWQGLGPEERHRITARAVLRTARADAALSHTSAALEYGVPLWNLPLDEVHTTRIGGTAGRREAGIVHHQGTLLPGDLTEREGIPVTSPMRTAVDLTVITDVEHALVPVNAMLQAGLMGENEFRARLAEAEHWPGSLSAHLVSQLINPACESPGETRLDYLCWAQGLPRPVPQVVIHGPDGTFLGRVDFAWPDHGVFLEFDGKVKYREHLRPGQDPSDVVVREKLREEAICRATGWRCIRVTWADLGDPKRLARRILAALQGGPSFAA